MNVEQPLEGGTILYQKSMPKRDKGGGIFPTAEGARLRTGRQRGGAAFAVPPHSVSRLSLAYNTRETRVWKQKPQKRYGQKFDATHCIRIINML